MTMKPTIYLLFFLLSVVHSKTITKYISTCDGYERQIIGERYIGTNVRGQIKCRFSAKDTSYALAFYFNSLSLRKQGDMCPVLKLIGYTSLIKTQGVDEDNRLNPGRAIEIPADPEEIIVVSCKNYTSEIGHVITAKKLNQKVELIFSATGTNKPQANPFDVTIFSFKTGFGSRCPDKHFQCWSDRHMCIDESLECDSEQNCRDNSDEDSFKCTGRIGALPLGMFIVILAVALLVIIGIVIGVIVYKRNQSRRRKKARAIVMEPHYQQQPFIGDPTQPRQYFVAPPESELSS